MLYGIFTTLYFQKNYIAYSAYFHSIYFFLCSLNRLKFY
jgi:hypothetical protein